MRIKMLFIALIAPGFCVAQQTNMQPGVGYDPNFQGTSLAGSSTARLIVAPGIEVDLDQLSQALRGGLGGPIAGRDIRAVIHVQDTLQAESERAIRVRYFSLIDKEPRVVFPEIWQQALRPPATAPGVNAARTATGRFVELVRPEWEKINRELIAQLRTFVRSEPDMPAPERARRVAELSAQLNSVKTQMDVLNRLSEAQPDAPKRLAERLRQLHDTQQGLQMRLIALQARREAIQEGLKKLQIEAEQRRQEDPAVAEIRKILELREREVQQTRHGVGQGVMAQGELARAEANLAETRLRLLERQAAIGKGGKGELMDRLTDELAMVSIDATEIQIQLVHLREEISRTDPTKLTSNALNELLRREPSLDPTNTQRTSPLYKELQQQAADLRLEWLKLVIDDIEYIEEPPAN